MIHGIILIQDILYQILIKGWIIMKNNFELTMAEKNLNSNYLNELAILSDENTLDLLKEQISTNLKSIGNYF